MILVALVMVHQLSIVFLVKEIYIFTVMNAYQYVQKIPMLTLLTICVKNVIVLVGSVMAH